MGFVNCNAGKLALVMNGSKELAEVLGYTELWGDIYEACVWVATLQVGFYAFTLGICGIGGDCFGGDTTLSGSIDLVCLCIRVSG
jgi:hypothetical protein